jgi:hypothetical protein
MTETGWKRICDCAAGSDDEIVLTRRVLRTLGDDWREHWRPFKPARVEAGQRWRRPGCYATSDLVTVINGDWVGFDYGTSARAKTMLTNDDWTWLPEGECGGASK